VIATALLGGPSFLTMAMNGGLNGHVSEEFDGESLGNSAAKDGFRHRLHNPCFCLDFTMQATRLPNCLAR
jgi:hypothetical protein